MVEGRRRGVAGRDKVLLHFSLATAFGVCLPWAFEAPLGSTVAAATTATTTMTSSGGFLSSCGDVVALCAADPSCIQCTGSLGEQISSLFSSAVSSTAVDDAAADDDEEASSTLCSSRYPSLVSGEDVSFCGRVGAAKCCEFSDNDVASSCLDDTLVAELWDCFLGNELGCQVSDMPCHTSVDLATEPPTVPPTFATASPTATPTGSPTGMPTTAPVSVMPTTSPTVVEEVAPTVMPTLASRGNLVVPTSTPTLSPDANDDVEGETASGAAGLLAARGDAGALALAFVLGVALMSAAPGSILALL